MLGFKKIPYYMWEEEIASFRKKLWAWYDANKRDLLGEGRRILIKFDFRNYAPADTCRYGDSLLQRFSELVSDSC